MPEYTYSPHDDNYFPPKQDVYLCLVQKGNYDNRVYLTKGQASDVEHEINRSTSSKEYYDLGTLCYNFNAGFIGGGKTVQVTIDDTEYAFIREIAIRRRFV